ncbi:MAG: low molecular weight protein arginine phosphatase [Candidatus Omnitrophota bacterium]
MGKVRSILLVCTGNSCRSVMAEGLLKKYLKEAGKGDIEVRSAGVIAVDGLGPTIETVETMKEEGIDVSNFRATRLTDELIKSSDLILVMEESHRAEIVERVPEAAPKTHLLKKFGAEDDKRHSEGFSIPDPIGRPPKDYGYCRETIKREIERIVKLL